MTRQPFIVREHVRWADVDYAGIIRYDAYTRFLELAESELFRSLGISYREFEKRFDFTTPRRALHLEFESPPTLDEQLEVATYVSKVGTTSLTMNFDIYGDGGVLRCFGHMVLVCVDKNAMQSRPWPVEFISLIETYRLSVQDARGVHVARAT